MLKLFVIFCVLFVQLISSKSVEDEIFQNHTQFSKIASGYDFIKGENSDFCYLTANFIEKQKTCGCFVDGGNAIATSARCVYE